MAALSVCLFHFINTTVGFVGNKYILRLTFVGQAGVNLFFVISGFIIPWAMYHSNYKFKNFFTFFYKRLLRLEPVYIASVVIAIALFFIRQKYIAKIESQSFISTNQILLHIGYLIPFFKNYQWLNMVYWTLAIEFQYYILIGLLFSLILKSTLISRCIIYVAAMFATYLFNWEFIFNWLPIFILGILLFLYKIKYIKKVEYYVATLVILVFCFFRFSIDVALFSAIPVIFILYFSNIKIIGLHFFGKFSYSFYLMHALIGTSFVNFFSHKCISPTQKITVILLGVFISTASAWVVYILVEKPTKKLSASINYK